MHGPVDAIFVLFTINFLPPPHFWARTMYKANNLKCGLSTLFKKELFVCAVNYCVGIYCSPPNCAESYTFNCLVCSFCNMRILTMNCEVREKTNKMQQLDVKDEKVLIINI